MISEDWIIIGIILILAVIFAWQTLDFFKRY